MNIGQLLLIALAVVWVVARQVTGRYVALGTMTVLPAVITVLGLYTLVQAHPPITAWTLVVVGADLLITAGLGVARGAATRLTLREGYLYQRGGAPTLLLWLLAIAARVGIEVFAVATGAGALVSASLALSLGISLAAQGAVLRRRVLADGRPLLPAAQGRGARRRSATLGR